MALTKEEKDQLVKKAIEDAAAVLVFTMHLLELNNNISGVVENDAGERYELEFKRLK